MLRNWHHFICYGTAPLKLQGSLPTGSTDILYQWEQSLDGIGFSTTARDYTPGVLRANTWFRRRVQSTGPCPAASAAATPTRVLYRRFIWGGFSYRHQDAWATMVGINLGHLFDVGYSYEITISGLKPGNGRQPRGKGRF